MHTSYAPDEINEDYMEEVCDDLHCHLITLFENDDEEFRQEAYDDAVMQLKHIQALLDEMVEEDERGDT